MARTTLAALAALMLCAAGCDDEEEPGDGAGLQTVVAGDGLTGGGSSASVTLAVDFTDVARAQHGHAFSELTGFPAAQSCSGTQKATGFNVATGAVTCAADLDTAGEGGGVTSVTAGAGLTGGTITDEGTLAVDFGQVSPLVHTHPGFQLIDEATLRFDGHIGLGAFPFSAIQVDDANASLVLRDRTGANPASITLDDGDGEGGTLNLVFQRVGEALGQIFLSNDPGNFLTFQSEGFGLRFKVSAAVEAMRITAEGFVGIGTPVPTHLLEVSDGEGDPAFSDGNSWVNASSRASKTDIRALSDDDLRTIRRWLDETEVVWYRYKHDADPRTRVGLIADDVPAALATADRKGISTADAIGFLTATAKQLAAENRRLVEENAALAGRLADLEKRMAKLEKTR